jgi:carbon monoxide dehydrogenase subunit G
MAIRIEERFVVRAPVGPVWDALVDPRRVVACVPGGELDEIVDERTFGGRVRVKVGAVTMAYRGRVRLAEVDVAARRVKIVGEARESTAAGSVRLTLESWLTALPDHGSEVMVVARVDVGGPMERFGRGFIEEVGHQLFRQFAACIRAAVEAEQTPLAAGTPPPAPRSRREPLAAVPLLLRALGAWLAGWFRPRGGGAPRAR